MHGCGHSLQLFLLLSCWNVLPLLELILVIQLPCRILFWFHSDCAYLIQNTIVQYSPEGSLTVSSQIRGLLWEDLLGNGQQCTYLSSIWWYIFSHIILCNLLTTILRPNFEDPIETAQQLVDNKMTLYEIPKAYMWKQFLEDSPIPAYNKLGETLYFTKDMKEYYYYSEHHIMVEGTHAVMLGYLDWEQ